MGDFGVNFLFHSSDNMTVVGLVYDAGPREWNSPPILNVLVQKYLQTNVLCFSHRSSRGLEPVGNRDIQRLGLLMASYADDCSNLNKSDG
jgi:hypothetical protein